MQFLVRLRTYTVLFVSLVQVITTLTHSWAAIPRYDRESSARGIPSEANDIRSAMFFPVVIVIVGAFVSQSARGRGRK